MSGNCSVFRATGAELHLGIGNGRDHDPVAAQHRLCQALLYGFRLLAHDELPKYLLAPEVSALLHYIPDLYRKTLVATL